MERLFSQFKEGMEMGMIAMDLCLPSPFGKETAGGRMLGRWRWPKRILPTHTRALLWLNSTAGEGEVLPRLPSQQMVFGGNEACRQHTFGLVTSNGTAKVERTLERRPGGDTPPPRSVRKI